MGTQVLRALPRSPFSQVSPSEVGLELWGVGGAWASASPLLASTLRQPSEDIHFPCLLPAVSPPFTPDPHL